MNLKQPTILKNLLSTEDFTELRHAVNEVLERGEFAFEESIGRKSFKMDVCPFMKYMLIKLTPVARRVFDSETLVPSYAFFAEYYSSDSFLPKHKDNAGNTYNLDLCLYADRDWPIYVEGQLYSFGVNEAVTMYGEDQFHWREKLGDNNVVGNVFFFYVEPEHPFFTDPEFDKN